MWKEFIGSITGFDGTGTGQQYQFLAYQEVL